jgi:hypothetical protein
MGLYLYSLYRLGKDLFGGVKVRASSKGVCSYVHSLESVTI